MVPTDWPGGSWEATLQWALLLIGGYWAAFWLAVSFWTLRDMRMRSGNWLFGAVATLMVAVGSLPGLALYLVMRPRTTRTQRYLRSLEEEALEVVLADEVSCPGCRRTVRDDYLVCPACLTQLKHSCLVCSKAIDQAWQLCPYCLAPANEAPSEAVLPIPVVRPMVAPPRPALSPNGLAS